VNDERSAVLLIRIWLEDEDDAFRARLTTLGPSGEAGTTQETTVAVAASPSVC
jgi:hypothetical protein